MNRFIIVSALSSLALLGACASSGRGMPTFGDEIKASAYGDLAKDWTRADRDYRDAQETVTDGENRIERGERLIKNARKDIKRGEELIERGEREIRQGQVAEAAALTRRTEIETRYNTVAGAQDTPASITAPAR